MVKKKSGSSVPDRQAKKNVRHIKDSEIDFSDIPESSDMELSKAKRVGRPKGQNNKQLIAIRLDPSLLSVLKKIAEQQDKPYQTLIHEFLEKSAKKFAA